MLICYQMFKWFKHTDRRDQFLRELQAYATSLTRDRDLAEELTQNILIKLIEKKKNNIPEEELRPYAFRMLRNAHIDHLRKQKVRMEYSTEQGRLLSENIRDGFDVVDQIIVRNAFSALSEEHREILFLVDVMRFKYAEAAETMGVPQGTIMSRVSRARAEMVKQLADTPVKKIGEFRKVKK